MRVPLFLLWLLLPLLAAAYHYGPGQRQMRIDEVGAVLKQAEASEAAGESASAVEAYSRALATLPGDMAHQAQRIRLAKAKAQMSAQMLPEAHEELTALVDELREDPNAAPRIVEEARAALASAQYYMTWLMRLEGAGRDEWEPEIEAARQAYRLLAEQALARQDEKVSRRHREDLEATIRLARMDLSELQGLSLPSQCRGCCSGKCKGKGKCRGRGRSQQKNQGEKDARGASSGPPPDGTGS